MSPNRARAGERAIGEPSVASVGSAVRRGARESGEQRASSARRARADAEAGAKRPRVTVLDEDEYTARLEAIIERDYFPDLRSNRLKAALAEATRAGDARAIAAIHREMGMERIRRVGSRGGVVGTPSIGGSGTTSAAFEEESWELETPRRRDDFEDESFEHENFALASEDNLLGPATAYEEDRHLSVDGFLARYTSEDNASFSDIIKQSEERREMKKRQMAAMTGPSSRRLALGDAMTSGTLALAKQAGSARKDSTSGKAKAIVGHDDYFTAPNGLALSLKERGGLLGKPRETIAKNTRFVAPSPRSATDKIQELKQYERVHTPSILPGVGASPLMTWGEIASTPLRLDDVNDGDAVGVGRFSMKTASAREQKLRELTSKNSSASATPTPRARRVPTPGLSAAAKSLLRRVTPSRRLTTPKGDFDADLRKSYSGSTTQVNRAPEKRTGSEGNLLRLD